MGRLRGEEGGGGGGGGAVGTRNVTLSSKQDFCFIYRFKKVKDGYEGSGVGRER